MMEYFDEEERQKQLVAVYAIGWPLTENMTKNIHSLRQRWMRRTSER